MAPLDGRSKERGRPRPAQMDWDDVRVFLAVARHGSLRAAGRALGLSQPTIARRLTEFEATFRGSTLFDRLSGDARTQALGCPTIAQHMLRFFPDQHYLLPPRSSASFAAAAPARRPNTAPAINPVPAG